MLFSIFVSALAFWSTALGAEWIESGVVWYDTDGKKIDAHGGSVFQKNGTFYWIGQSASNSISLCPYLGVFSY
jgi:hypothetical protein